ncbi:hypothetical protein Q8A73_016181 [Channa argus]|nr:hypothetical protein Q8A73_016181 [Channa argus]
MSDQKTVGGDGVGPGLCAWLWFRLDPQLHEQSPGPELSPDRRPWNGIVFGMMLNSVLTCDPSTSQDNISFFLSGLCLSFFLFLTLLAQQYVNDAPHQSLEQWEDSSLCDGCGVLSKTKGTWQAAELRLDQTGLVYWTSLSLLCAHQWLCVRLQSEVSEGSAHSSKTGTTQTTHRAISTTTKEDQNRD